MNKTYLFGRIASIPRLVNRVDMPAHLVFLLDVSHKTAKGEIKHEMYPISLWNNKALWGSRALRTGQYITVDGKLTQRPNNNQSAEVLRSIEIAADEIILSLNGRTPYAVEKAPAVEESSECDSICPEGT